MTQNDIRNFVIISHIDHGKSTLADRFLELTGAIAKDKLVPQMLDQHPIERERGITIKMQPVRMRYVISNHEYILNLIDTPGHVDFSYEVSRALSCVQGAILLVDGTQGIQAQTLSNYYLAKEQGLTIIPVINKIDLPHAQVDRVSEAITQLIRSPKKPYRISAKTGEGVKELLKGIIESIPSPKGSPDQPLQALIFDSIYDIHRGVVAYTTIFNGSVSTGDTIRLLGSQTVTLAKEVGYFMPKFQPVNRLQAGTIGYIVTNVKYIRTIPVGDTITKVKIQKLKFKSDYEDTAITESVRALAGYEPPRPMVWASVFPSSPGGTPLLRESLKKLQLNDAALQFEPENAPVLGAGFRLGVLGLLHLDIVIERLKRDFGQSVVVTKPSVAYRLPTKDNNYSEIYSMSQLPDDLHGLTIEEPWLAVTVVAPIPYLGGIHELAAKRRGKIIESQYLAGQRAILIFELPLAEMVVDFYDQLKSISAGYASLSYKWLKWQPADLVKMAILIAGEVVEPLTQLVLRRKADQMAHMVVGKLKDLVPRQNFEVKIQAQVNGKILATERIAPFRKDVTAKLYGGDVTRKRKLLEKQKEGKKRLRQFGAVQLTTEFFHAALRL